ncbi:MAG: hypothetical protein A2381_15720 [Bdellovibrionales bacterium RIFOXYB1_FULL_37_110]|nr:MAG: hypothetical protein A2417_07570 [Bdellovibrionales bacterium RIFOXYC1_FULL_37_79]OFZ57064.1 MAG: hypothetical protein A2381_15720 [Bdellovibrionales bacterium RIFOXYB1_FULL_37_110]OFZ64882.1 MAG: hypothetical protein A2577_16880 [Bdellovibrionales bacterium RIFOXYD1_FULL_36_51]
MKLNQILIVIVSLFFTITGYSATTEVSLTFSIGMYSPISIVGKVTNADLLDGNHAHRFILYINDQFIDHFEPITAANSLPEGNGYTTTVIYTGSILCDNCTSSQFIRMGDQTIDNRPYRLFVTEYTYSDGNTYVLETLVPRSSLFEGVIEYILYNKASNLWIDRRYFNYSSI